MANGRVETQRERVRATLDAARAYFIHYSNVRLTTAGIVVSAAVVSSVLMYNEDIPGVWSVSVVTLLLVAGLMIIAYFRLL